MSSRELTLTRRLVCYVLSGALALSVVPAPALAEALGATDELAYPDEWDESEEQFADAIEQDEGIIEEPEALGGVDKEDSVNEPQAAEGQASVGADTVQNDTSDSEKSKTEELVDSVEDNQLEGVSQENATDSENTVDAINSVSEWSDFELDEAPLSGQAANGATTVSGKWGTCSWSIDAEGTLRVGPGKGADSTRPDFEGSYYESMVPWYSYRDSIKTAILENGIILPSKCRGLFYNCSNLVSVTAYRADTSAVSDMASMFNGCSSLKSVDLYKWDTSNVTNMSYMFSYCSALERLDDVSDWDVSNVTDMQAVFDNCSSLKELDVSGWNTSSATTFNQMFYGCSSLASLDIASWNVSNVAYMHEMFKGCSSLAYLDCSRWNPKPKGMSSVFEDCTSLVSLDLSKWDISSVTSIDSAFACCESLKSVNISGWDTSHVTDMDRVFVMCRSLEEIDVSNWDTSHVTNMLLLFRGCSSVKTLDLSRWDTSSIEFVYGMFDGNTSLESIRIGNKYDMSVGGDYSSSMFPEGHTSMGWWSSNNKQWYGKSEIISSRSRVADTYLAAAGIDQATVTVSPSSYVYDGTAKMPTVTVKDGSTTLRSGTDYTVSMPSSACINVGTYNITVTGKGNYTGATTASFTIAKATPTLEFASASVGKKVTDAAFTNALTKTTDGAVTFSSSNTAVATVDPSTGKVTIKGAGKATITAKAAAGKNYKAGSASYALTVTASKTYSVSYDANGGTGTPSPQTKVEGVALKLSGAKPTKSFLVRYNASGGSVSPASKSVSCAFTGWNTRKDGKGASYAAGGSYEADAGATLYAQWANPKAGALATPTRNGYDFAGWYTSATGGSKVTSSTAVSSNMTVYARWSQQGDPYDMGDETYSFDNYVDPDSPFGHCFGMSMTSAGYHLGLLDIRRIGGNASTPLYGFGRTDTVKRPICYYQGIQDKWSKGAIVAGGSSYLYGYYDIDSDWKAVVSYVKSHKYDGTGQLQIGFRKNDEGGHAINFLRYESVGGQDRIYAYDNNCPDQEVYFYRDAYGRVFEAPYQIFSGAIDCIALRDVRTYFNSVGDFDATRVVYARKDCTSLPGYAYSFMEGLESDIEYVMYVIPASVDRVTVIPSKDNADFIYMGTEYSFGEVTDSTRGKLELATMREGAVVEKEVFTIYEGESDRFPDVKKGSWYYAVVNRAADLGLVGGYASGKFGPDDNITRGQVAVILWRMAGQPKAGPGAKSFTDVKSGAYYYHAVRWASAAGVVSGYGDGRFRPDDKVTREQLAVMLANYARKVGGLAVSGSKADFASMRDASSVAGYAQPAVGWCFKNKILSGSNGNVLPKGNATRAQAAKMLVFLYDMVS